MAARGYPTQLDTSANTSLMENIHRRCIQAHIFCLLMISSRLLRALEDTFWLQSNVLGQTETR